MRKLAATCLLILAASTAFAPPAYGSPADVPVLLAPAR